MPIRPFTIEDIAVAQSIVNTTMTDGWDEKVFQDCIRKPHYQGWVFTLEDNVIGFILILIHEKECELMNLAVESVYQRQGYATQLLKYAIADLQSQKIRHLFLEVRRSNEAAIRLYKKFGSSDKGIRKNYYPAGKGREDALVFVINL